MTAPAPASGLVLSLNSPEATRRTAHRLAGHLRPGDSLLLEGGIGAGKTHFARSLIQALQDTPEDVPSPTFTLVQTYDTRAGEVWHADLYRLTAPDECIELGLTEAFASAICLVEWPDRLADLAPDDALTLRFQTGADEDTRRLTLSWSDARWSRRVAALAGDTTADFLAKAGWDEAERTPIAGDASSRRYTRLTKHDQTAVLMEDPDGDTARFAAIARHLSGLGLSAPAILQEAHGLLLLEDLGDGLVSRLVTDADSEKRLYLTAVQPLITLAAHRAPPSLPVATPEWLAAACDLAFTEYARTPALIDQAAPALRGLIAEHAPPEEVMVLRDYHADNILILPGRTGAARAGLLDFQDALSGHAAYDLVSLLRDVRRDIQPETERACLDAYLGATGTDRGSFGAAYAVLGVQRNLRILGVFARLARRGKPGYLAFLPRTWAHIRDQLSHPALSSLRPIVDALPEPTPEHIERLRRPCPTP